MQARLAPMGTGYEKNLESGPSQVFQQAGVAGQKADSVGPPGRG